MAKNRKRTLPVRFEQSPVGRLSFYLTLALLVLVPLALSTLVYTKYTLPKFVVLLVGSSLVFLFLALERRDLSPAEGPPLRMFRSNLVRVVFLYFLVLGGSTAFGVNPIGSLFGSFSYMGLLTLTCCVIVFVALIRGASTSEKRLRAILLTIAGTGFLVAIYAVAQSFGIEPFVTQSTYTFTSPTGPLVRVCSTLGHSDYLGNFLLYTTLTTAALGVAERGPLRFLAIGATGLSVAAIAFSGTRGSWIGLVAGVMVFAILELRNGSPRGFLTKRGFVAAAAGMVLVAGLVVLSPAARSAAARARALMNEGISSSGRVLLWRDSIKMIPAFPLIGCGPEGFRKAFLGFKSKALAQLSPKANNENPHNAYISAALSYGLLGAGLYVAMIVLALVFLMRSRRRAREEKWRMVITGLVSSFAAVIVHNIFIFDQIATALYFFAFLALAQVTHNVVEARKSETPINEKSAASQMVPKGRKPLVVAVAGICVVVSIWYTAGLVSSDIAYKDLISPANPVDYDGLVRAGRRITSSPLPTGAYDFLFARAVDGFIRKLPMANQAANSGVDLNAVRAQSLRLATEHVEKSLAHTFTPEMNYSLLGTLALTAGDVNKLRSAATSAVNSDPNNYYTRWLLAEAYLVSGENERAAREAEIALDLYPASLEAASTLARARGLNRADDSAALVTLAEARNARPNLKRTAEDLVEVGRKLSQAGKLKKARIKLVTAIGRANGPCASCHRELAIVYEKMGRYSDAITEWEISIQQTPAQASEQVKAHIEDLRAKTPKP